MCKRKRAAKVTARMDFRKESAAIGIVPQAVLTYPFNSKGRQNIRIAARMRCRWHATIRLRLKKYGNRRWSAVFSRRILFERGSRDEHHIVEGLDRPGVLCYTSGSASPFVVPFTRFMAKGVHTRWAGVEANVEMARERVVWEDGLRIGSNPRFLSVDSAPRYQHRLGLGLQAADETYVTRQQISAPTSETTREWHRVRDDCSVETCLSVLSPGREWYLQVDALMDSQPKPGSSAYYETRWLRAERGLHVPPMGVGFIQPTFQFTPLPPPPAVPDLPKVDWKLIVPDQFQTTVRAKVSPGPEWELA